MYRMILVDDEAIIREGISSCVPWEDNGFFLAGVFEHGQQALEYIEQNPVDVVLSDINMPRMNGLELSRILGERFPEITVILLTGYDDFEYAQEAVRNQVREFLLKPITQNELSKVISTIKEELDIRKENKKAHEILLAKLEQSFPLLKERFLCRIISGNVDASIDARKEYFGLTDLSAFYRVVSISFPSDWNDLEQLSLSESLQEKVRQEDEIFFDRNEDLILLLQGTDADELNRRSMALAEAAFLFVSGMGKKHISAGCGDIVDSKESIPLSYKSASKAVEYSRILGLDHILSLKDITSREHMSSAGFTSRCRDVINSLKEGGKKQGLSALKELKEYLASHYQTEAQLNVGFMKFYYMLSGFAHEMELYKDNQDPIPVSTDSFTSLDKAEAFFEKLIDSIDILIDKRRNDMLLSRIDRAKSIINQRFRENRFSLQDICDELYLSTSQFSLLFKEGTGQTFVEYLTACRVEEAKKLLLSTDLKGYEVAEQVGYTDPRYFTIIFKKQTGMTAMEYRRSRK